MQENNLWEDLFPEVAEFWDKAALSLALKRCFNQTRIPGERERKAFQNIRGAVWVEPENYYGVEVLIPLAAPRVYEKKPFGETKRKRKEAGEDLLVSIEGKKVSLEEGYFEVGLSSHGPFAYVIMVEVDGIIHHPRVTPREKMKSGELRKEILHALKIIGYGVIPDSLLSEPLLMNPDYPPASANTPHPTTTTPTTTTATPTTTPTAKPTTPPSYVNLTDRKKQDRELHGDSVQDTPYKHPQYNPPKQYKQYKQHHHVATVFSALFDPDMRVPFDL